MENEELPLQQTTDEDNINMLLFNLGTSETFGMNVLPIREITKVISIRETSSAGEGIKGVISLRGNIIPVIDLGYFLKIPQREQEKDVLIVTEFDGKMYAFSVFSVDHITSFPKEKLIGAASILGGDLGLITFVVQINENTLVSIVDIEKTLSELYEKQ